MNYAEAAIVRARTVLSLFVVIMLAGIYSYAVIPLEANPDVSVPVVLITVPHEGITPHDSERLLARPLELEQPGRKTGGSDGNAEAPLEQGPPLRGPRGLPPTCPLERGRSGVRRSRRGNDRSPQGGASRGASRGGRCGGDVGG